MQLTKFWVAQLDDYAIDLAWSPDGARLAAASAAGPISIFATDSGHQVHELPGHDDGSNALAWRPAPCDAPGSPALLASGGQDGTVKFWDADAGQHTGTAKLGSAWVEHLSWRPLPARTSMSSEPATPPPTGGASGPATFVAAAAGRDLVFVNADGAVRHRFRPAAKTISTLAWHPAGGAIAAAHFGGVCLWDADDFIAQKEFAYDNGIHALVWSPDGKWLVSGNQDPSVHLWIPDTGTELHMSGYETKVKFLSFDHTSRWLATSGGRDGCVWDCSGDGPEGREPAMLPHEAPVCAVRFQNLQGLLATASQEGVVQFWSPERNQPLRATVRMPSAASKLAWSPDDRFLAIGSEKGAVYVLKCET